MNTPAETDTPDIATAYTSLAAGFADVADAIDAADWDRPSPCEGWTARDVVGHVIDTQRDFFTEHDVALADSLPLDDQASAWRAHANAVAQALGDDSIAGKGFDGHFGPTTVGDTLLRFYGFDMIAHRWRRGGSRSPTRLHRRRTDHPGAGRRRIRRRPLRRRSVPTHHRPRRRRPADPVAGPARAFGAAAALTDRVHPHSRQADVTRRDAAE